MAVLLFSHLSNGINQILAAFLLSVGMMGSGHHQLALVYTRLVASDHIFPLASQLPVDNSLLQ
jgi:hypothetical protein